MRLLHWDLVSAMQTVPITDVAELSVFICFYFFSSVLSPNILESSHHRDSLLWLLGGNQCFKSNNCSVQCGVLLIQV